jgi:hypothetical protein
MFLAALGDGDHPLLDAVRAGEGEPDSDEFAQLLRALEGGEPPEHFREEDI